MVEMKPHLQHETCICNMKPHKSYVKLRNTHEVTCPTRNHRAVIHMKPYDLHGFTVFTKKQKWTHKVIPAMQNKSTKYYFICINYYSIVYFFLMNKTLNQKK